MKTRTKKQEPTEVSIETFRDPRPYGLRSLTQDDPYCLNDTVGFRKWRITVSLVDEPKEVLEARLRNLWAGTDNWHHVPHLRREAAKLGIELDSKDCGAFKPRKKNAANP